MDEKQILKQLKNLKAIKPNKDWVVLAKERILGRKEEEKFVLGGSWLLRPRIKPAFALGALAVATLALVAGLFYNNSQKPALVYDGLQKMLARIVSEDQGNKNVLSSLEGLQAELNNIKASLENLKSAKDPGQALAMIEVVKATAKRNKEVVRTLQNSERGLSRKIKAGLGEIGEISEGLEKDSEQAQKEIFEAYLQDLKTRSLSEEDQARLQKAEQYYEEGKNSEAMILLIRIGSQ